jgi:single-stranded-DNA-specific exonuclease
MLKIVAIGTVADLAPLAGENRVFVKIGLEGLRNPRNPGLEALLQVAGLRDKGGVTAGDVGFRIGPRINAAGRMDTARDVVELFTTPDPARAEELARKLDGLNAERQAAEEAVVEEILERLGRVPPPDVLPFLVVEGEGWHPGVIGICASRIVERFHRPTLVLSVDPETGLATGSGRSIPAFHLVEALEALAPIFERFGGHKMAAGCTLKADRIEALRDGLNEHALNLLGPDDFVPELLVDDELAFAAIGDELMGSIAKLAPHGLGNPTPIFATAGVRLAGEPRVLKEKHLKLRLDHGGSNLWAMGWRMAALHPSLTLGAAMDAAYAVEADDYWGGWRLNLKDLRAAGLEA